MISWRTFGIVGGLAFLALAAWTLEPVIFNRGSESGTGSDRPAMTPVGTSSLSDPVLVGAGDIAACTQENDAQTAALVEQVLAEGDAKGIETSAFTTGDNAYEEGTLQNYEQCYGPTWGRFQERTWPVLGNHEYELGNADGSFEYFGEALGRPGEGYYSFDWGSWHVVVLNTSDNCQVVVTCEEGSAQEQWLRADLAEHPSYCTLAIFHEPLFSSAPRPNSARYLVPFWRALYEFGADVIVNGHEHNYERFAPQTADALFDPAHGIRQFVVGTGGNGHRSFESPSEHNSEVGNDVAYGVIRLTLHPDSYDWEFLPVPGETFRDGGTGDCHAAPPPDESVQ
jgi:hypothetical protein